LSLKISPDLKLKKLIFLIIVSLHKHVVQNREQSRLETMRGTRSCDTRLPRGYSGVSARHNS